MIKKLTKIKLIYLLGILAFLTSCTPGPPPPPIFPGFEWVVIGLVVFMGVLLWKNYSSPKEKNDNYITDALNEINQQLKKLEEKINELEKETKSNKNN